MADRPFVANSPGHHHLRHPLRPRDMTTRTAPAAWQWGAPLHAPRHSRGAGVSSSGSPAPSCPQNSSWPPPGAHTHTLCTSVRRSLSGEPRWPALRPSAAAGRGPDPAQADASRSLTAEWDPEPPDLRWDKRMGVRKGLALDGRPPRAPGTCAGSGDLRGVPLLWPREGGRGRPRLEGAALSLGHADECSRTPAHPEQLYELCVDRMQPPWCGGQGPGSSKLHDSSSRNQLLAPWPVLSPCECHFH